MVNYQGPAAIRGLVEAMEVPIFNRVSQIGYEFKDVSEIPLDKEIVSRMHELERISVSKRQAEFVNESDIKAVEALVPPCRVVSVGNTKNRINVQVDPGSRFACCSQ